MDLDDTVVAKERVAAIADRHETFLGLYWSAEDATFRADPRKEREAHITTACTSILSFLEVPVGGRLPDYIERARTDFGEWLSAQAWTSEDLPENNPYTAPMAIETLAKLGRLHAHLDKVARASEALVAALESEPRGSVAFVDRYPPNGFLTYWVHRALRDVLEMAGTEVWADEARRAEIEQLLDEALEWGVQEVYRQLAFHATADLDHFDALQLAYALVLADVRDQRRGRPPNLPLLKHGLGVFFERQRPDGLWEKNFPIFHFAKLGNAYPFSFETLTAVLQLGARGDVTGVQAFREELFAPHVGGLLRVFGWAAAHEVHGAQPGWRSNTVPPGSPPSAWATAMVLSFCRGLHLLLDRMGRDLILREFRARVPSRATAEELGPETWSPRADSLTNIQGAADPVSLKGLIYDHFIAPRQTDGDIGKAAWTAILFGPPGTAKTTLAEHLAGALGWPLVTLSTSDFLGSGLDRMAYQARLIFQKLNELSSTVVLIDEVEEFVRKREGGKTDTEIANRLITTAMLTLLQELRNRERVILLLATNRVEEFDPAIRRPGRFDLVLNVGPPSFAAKSRLLADAFGGALRDGLPEVLATQTKIVERATFSEWRQLTRWAEEHPEATPQELETRLVEFGKQLTISADDWEQWQQPSQVNLA